MSTDLISNPVMREMTAYLDRLVQRQTVVATNVANIDTPGYKAKDVEFSNNLDEALGGTLHRTDPHHLTGDGLPSGGRIMEVKDLPSRLDHNNVSLDREATKLAEIAIRFSATAQMYQLRLRTIKQAILEGR